MEYKVAVVTPKNRAPLIHKVLKVFIIFLSWLFLNDFFNSLLVDLSVDLSFLACFMMRCSNEKGFFHNFLRALEKF